MKLKNIPQNNLTAAVTLLSPYCPELSPTALVEALKEHEPNKCRDVPRYLNKHEAAQIFGVSWFTLVEWAKAGKIPAVKIGGQWRFRADKLEGGNDD